MPIDPDVWSSMNEFNRHNPTNQIGEFSNTTKANQQYFTQKHTGWPISLINHLLYIRVAFYAVLLPGTCVR